ncbi:carbamoyltransferase [Tateyamaria omphalii]|uniref:carbamoyltransferase C-terminal domain-containing protein n=1 Tax=Tateyamaria omphalii TaxID=299262 RepID=UPI001677A899|nr:carbamoyltransferase C-terminal domain-containing protein [Tateyamaria omphalii]GGX66742.1 carbamoyltransferase [Tateyamaria omphalii]
MLTLGLHSLGHDTGVCLWDEGELVFTMETERLTRVRYETRVDAALKAVRAHPSFDPNRIGRIASSSHFRRNILDVPQPDLAERALISERKLHYNTVSSMFGRDIPCTIVSHEVSHAVLGLHEAGWRDRTLILVNEGRGVFSRNALYFYADGRLQLVDWNLMPWFGTGFGWSSVGYLVGLGRHPGVAGKAMALGGFQGPGARESAALRDVDPCIADLSEPDQTQQADRLLGELGGSLDFDGKCRLVASLQDLFVSAIIGRVTEAVGEHNAQAVALSGGCALNIVANSALRNALSVPLFVPSACNDAGQALGAALYAQMFVDGVQPGAFALCALGDPVTPETAARFLAQRGMSSVDASPQRVGRMLAEGKVIAVAQGQSEIGPRALGNRSILADPNVPGVKERVSERLKGRESFRPLAPIMREETFARILPGRPESPAMLFNFDVTGLGFGAAAHVDNTARIQTVSQSQNPFVHAVLGEFEPLSGSPALINTSLNSGGRPICLTESDVFDDFPSGTVDAYVLADRLVVAS